MVFFLHRHWVKSLYLLPVNHAIWKDYSPTITDLKTEIQTKETDPLEVPDANSVPMPTLKTQLQD